MSRPSDLTVLAERLAERHLRACLSQIHRLDTAYRTFLQACQFEEATLPGSASIKVSKSEPAKSDEYLGKEAVSTPSAEQITSASCATRSAYMTGDSAEGVLRRGIGAYFETHDNGLPAVPTAACPDAEESLPLKPADSLLGADARALVVKLQQVSKSQVGSSKVSLQFLALAEVTQTSLLCALVCNPSRPDILSLGSEDGR